MSAPAHYSVLGPLRSGAQTRAFLGCEVVEGVPRADRPVVVVWLPDDVVSDPKQVARLQRETAFVTQLRHPNIIRVHGLECFEEGWARVVDFVDGEPLSTVLERAREVFRPIDPRAAARIVIDVCEAVHYAHEEGQSRFAGRPVVHGGIRPDTLMMTFAGRATVTGYGASVLAPTQHGTPIADKFVYFAPEQIIGGKATASPATDVYAIGALLYELLAGKPPFADAPDLERAVLTGEPPIIDAPGLEGRLGNVASTALAKRGSERFETVEVMKDAILAALAGEGVEPATHEDIAELVGALIPPEAPERVSRAELLTSAEDPDAVTILSPSTETPEGVDPALFARSRPVSVATRPPRKREEVTVVDGQPPITATIRAPLPRDADTVVEAPEAAPTPSAVAGPAASESVGPPADWSEADEITDDIRRPSADQIDAAPAVPAPAPTAPGLAAPAPTAPGLAAPAPTAPAPTAPGLAAPAPTAPGLAAPAPAAPATAPALAAPAPTAPGVPAPASTAPGVPAPAPTAPALAAPASTAPGQAAPAAPGQAAPAPGAPAQAPRAPAAPASAAQAVLQPPDAPAPASPGFTHAAASGLDAQAVLHPPGAPAPASPGFAPAAPAAPGYAAAPSGQMPPAAAPHPSQLGAASSAQGHMAPAPAGHYPAQHPMAHSGVPTAGQPHFGPGGTVPPPPTTGTQRPVPRGFVPPAAKSSKQNYLPTTPPAGSPPTPAGLLTNPPVSGLGPPPAPQKSSAIRTNAEITQFNKKAGDSSRFIVFLVLAGALAMAVFIFASKEPPAGLDAQPERHRLPKELVQEALRNAGHDDEPVEGGEDDEPLAALAAAATDGGAAPALDTEGNPIPPAPPEPGTLRLDADPRVSVFKGQELLGRTPVTVTLPPGRHRLRFTDAKTGINVYKTYRVRAGADHRHKAIFGTSKLIIEAPEGATILLNARRLGRAPIEPVTIYEGKYLLRVQYDGMSWSERFDAPPGQRIEYKVNLK